MKASTLWNDILTKKFPCFNVELKSKEVSISLVLGSRDCKMRSWSSITGWWRRKTADRTWGSRLRETRRRVTAGEILRQHTHNFTQTQILETFLDKYETRLEKSNFPPDRNHMGELTNPPGRRAPPPLSDSWSCCLNTKHPTHCLFFPFWSHHSFTSTSFCENIFHRGKYWIGWLGLRSCLTTSFLPTKPRDLPRSHLAVEPRARTAWRWTQPLLEPGIDVDLSSF